MLRGIRAVFAIGVTLVQVMGSAVANASDGVVLADSSGQALPLLPAFTQRAMRLGLPVLVVMSRRGPETRSGHFMLVGEDRRLFAAGISSEHLSLLHRNPKPLRLHDVLDREFLHGEIRKVIRRASTLACAVLERLPGDGSRYAVMRLSRPQWIIGPEGRLPDRVRFSLRPGCSIQSGARYLIPIPRGFRAETLTLDCCPRKLLVMGPEAVAFGLKLDELSGVIGRDARGRLTIVEPVWNRFRPGQAP